MYNSTHHLHAAKAAMMLLALLCSVSIWAADVTAEQALQQAQNFLKSHQTVGGPRHIPGTVPQLKPATLVNGFYLFNTASGDGYVIVSNDDRTVPVLGFGDQGNIDPDNMPENMKAWLQGYADEIAWLKQHGGNG